uniref:Uncharacterized protein n=1 Tax=Litorilinea aerophila TaxID=1204385 RepID=A0A540V8S0_9CHLR
MYWEGGPAGAGGGAASWGASAAGASGAGVAGDAHAAINSATMANRGKSRTLKDLGRFRCMRTSFWSKIWLLYTSVQVSPHPGWVQGHGGCSGGSQAKARRSRRSTLGDSVNYPMEFVGKTRIGRESNVTPGPSKL